jgi:ribonuclease E
MTKRMLIDAAHAEETRVVVVDGQRIEELDFESLSRKQLRGNIYLAKVTRVEPSLQAAFIEYGGNRHGFLAFNEIHPDYYQIPHADREVLMREEAEEEAQHAPAIDADDTDEDEMDEAVERRRRRLMRRYKIQEVIKRRQIMLVQVVKEERGNKGAALTTYLSLAGRYCVLMPNTARGGGISRKITSITDRKRLKSAVSALDVPKGMGLIIRTAGAARTKLEIKRDYEYLTRLWEDIREKTLQSIAPALIYEEEDLVKRAIRDMFDKDLESIQVEGEAGYKEARDFMRMIMPSQAKKVVHYREPTPLFVKHRVEDQISQIHSPVVQLKSGGYLVINQTEALVAIDVNSGRSTKERNIETTALKTNIEAAEEAARQLRLRDLAGLIVIDFIDMDEAKNNRTVEKVLKDALKDDRARLQMGKISGFGLMELSRQRRRSGVLEGSTHVCDHCQGTGRVRSVESSAVAALRAIEMESVKGGAGAITVRLPTAVGLYILNEKRAYLAGLDTTHDLHVSVREPRRAAARIGAHRS